MVYKIVMIRHGESVWNKENRFCGWFDADLSEKGKMTLMGTRSPKTLPRSSSIIIYFSYQIIKCLNPRILGIIVIAKIN